MRSYRIRPLACLALIFACVAIAPPENLPKITELELTINGLTATVAPLNPVIPKNVMGGVRVTVNAGTGVISAAELAKYLGGTVRAQAELSGPGLDQTLTIGDPEAGTAATDPLLLPFPPLDTAGTYTLSNIRLVVNRATVLNVTPGTIAVQVIDQVLVTSVETHAMTMEEIQQAGIVLDDSSYLGFQFTMGLMIQSTPVTISFPAVFDANGVPVPQPTQPPVIVELPGIDIPSPTIVPIMLKIPGAEGGGGGSDAGQQNFPSVIVIPGSVGYLKQFFEADLYVANGSPAGSSLVVHNVTGTIHLPAGSDAEPGTADDPLVLPSLTTGPQQTTESVVREGSDPNRLTPGESGKASWSIRGEKEGFQPLTFDVSGILEGLATGPVSISGTAHGGVLVRNPYFDLSFIVPSTVRKGEAFKLFVTVTNISQSPANNVTVGFDRAAISGVSPIGDISKVISNLNPKDSKTLVFSFMPERNGKLVATYLRLDTENGSTGTLHFTLGIDERGVALSPDTLVLPAVVDNLPDDVVEAAMRVLGQAWSVANAPGGTLPTGVIRISKSVATRKALALAEAGLRVELGQPLQNAMRDLLQDFYGGSPVDPGFDQLLRTTEAGRDLVNVLGAHLAPGMANVGGPQNYFHEYSELLASDLAGVAFAVASGAGNAPVSIDLADAGGGHLTDSGSSSVQGGVLVPLGEPGGSPLLGLMTSPVSWPYTLTFTGTASGTLDVAVVLPKGDGTLLYGQALGVPVSPQEKMKVVLNFLDSGNLVLRQDANNDGVFEAETALATDMLTPQGPQFLSATVVGPEILDGAMPFGTNVALLFDRPVDSASARNTANYAIPNNTVHSASSQLSGRIVFATLNEPEGPYVPTTVSVAGIADHRLAVGPGRTVDLQSKLVNPGAVVTGQVLNANGTPNTNAVVTYTNNPTRPDCREPSDQVGIAATPVNAVGYYQFRYVWQNDCGYPFEVMTKNPQTGAVQKVSSYVRAPAEQIVVNLALLGAGSVTGRVSDLSGAPVSGAQVLVISGTDPQVGGVATTDASGKYTVTGITVGPVTVTAVKDASLGNSAGNIEYAGTAAVVNITLNGGTVQVSGKVTQIQGGVSSPVPGLQVVYYGNSIPAGITRTGIDGSYSIKNLPTGPYVIEAAINSVLVARQHGVASAGDSLVIPLEIVPPATGTITGKVLLADGTPYGGAVVFENGVTAGVLSGDDGSYTLSGLPIRPSDVQTISAITKDGVRAGKVDVSVNSPVPLTGVNIVLSGVGRAQFTLLDTAGEPVPGKPVYLVFEGHCAGTPQTTDQNGMVTFTGLPVGTVKAVSVQTYGHYNDLASATVSITQDGALASGILRFQGVGTVTGTIVDPNGNPVIGASVQLSANNVDLGSCSMANKVVQTGQSDGLGRFRFSNVNVGPVSVSATQAFYSAPAGAHGVLPANGATVGFSLQFVNSTAGVLSGTVYMPDGLTPAQMAKVTANGPFPSTMEVSVTANQTGFYRFAKVIPAGTYTLTASDPVSGGVTQTRIYLRAAQNTTQNLRLLGTGTINVSVVDGDGDAVTSAFVTLTETNYPNASFNGSADASNQGVISFGGVYEGDFSVEVIDPLGRGGRASGALTQGVTSLDLKVQLTTTGTVEGHFYLPDGTTPIPNATITLNANGRVIGQATTLGTGDVGFYRFTHVPAGPVTLNGLDPLTGRTGAATGSIAKQGQTLSLDITAQGLGTVEGLVTSNGGPQPGASVTIVSGTFSATTSADANGLYLMTGVPSGAVVVTASLGDGFLRGTASATLAGDGNTLDVPVALQNSGSITGQVLTADGLSPAPPSLITVEIGGGSQQTTSDVQGNFAFDKVPAGDGTIHAREMSGPDQGSSPVSVPVGGSTNVIVKLNGTGSIEGLVLDSSGRPIRGTVSINGTGAFPYYYTIVAADDGTFVLPVVPAGPFTAVLSSNITGFRLWGTANGEVTPYKTTQFTIHAQPTGSVSGRVFLSGGSGPASGAVVTLANSYSGSGTVIADAAGNYRLEYVPLGSFVLDATDPLTGDRGTATNTIQSDGENVALDITMNGVGTVTVQVQDASGLGIANAALTLTSKTSFGGSYSGTADGAGTYTFPHVLAGDFTLSATDPASGLGAWTTGSVAPFGRTTLTVRLQPVLTVMGTVYLPDGVTPVPSSTVTLSGKDVNGDFYSVQTSTAADGTFHFLNLVQGSYSLISYDDSGAVRARSTSFWLLPHSPTVVNLSWQDIGSVSGHVYNPDGSPAPAAQVILLPVNTSIDPFLQTVTDGTGAYSFGAVPTGSFTLSVSYPSEQLVGRALGSVGQPGEQVTVDVYLASSAISLPVFLSDGNNYRFDPQPDGSLRQGESIFEVPGSVDTGAFILDVISSNSEYRFSGNYEGTKELDGRQVDIRQVSLAGLDVTRKIYVPRDGYFIRYVDVLTNPSATPANVDVRLTSNQLARNWPATIIASSSGGATLNVSDAQNPDRWVVIDEAEGFSEPFERPVAAYVFDGPGATLPVDSAQFVTPLYNSAQIVYQWSNVAIPPGGSVAFLHFGVQQSSRTAAKASAERLVQLPPEALVGIAPEDRALIRNFALPANGVSTVPPLPRLDGTVSGHVYSGDGVTPVPQRTVTLRSNNPYFGRAIEGSTDSTGAFSCTSLLNSSESSMVIPVDSFNLSASSAIVQGDFPQGQTSATQDLILAGTGTITGTVAFFNGGPATGAQVSASSSDFFSYSDVTRGDGTYLLAGIPAGAVDVNAYISPGSSRALRGSSSATVIAGQNTVSDIVLQGTGSISGTILSASGTPVRSVNLTLYLNYSVLFTQTDSLGHYSYRNLPTGDYSIQAGSGYQQFPLAHVTVVAGQDTIQDFTWPALGKVQVTVTYFNGAPAPGSYVQINGNQSLAGTTDSSGKVAIPSVPTGPFTAIARYPGNWQTSSEVTGTLDSDGATANVTVVLPGTASIAGQVRLAGGAGAPGVTVYAYSSESYTYSSVVSDSNGNYAFTGLFSGSTVSITTSRGNYQASVKVGAPGTTTELNITLPFMATVRVTVAHANGSPAAWQTVYIAQGGQSSFVYGSSTDSSGVALIPNVGEGDFIVRTLDVHTGNVSGIASGTLSASDDGATVAVNIILGFSANVQGTVFAADGQTPVANATVFALDPASGTQIGSTSTSWDGTYQLSEIAPSGMNFEVTAIAPSNPDITVSTNGSFVVAGETKTIDLILPVATVTGVVRFSDGRPVAYPTVFATQTDSSGSQWTYYPLSTDENGNYTVQGLRQGEFSVFAQDSSTGLNGTATSSIVQLDAPVQVPVNLQPSGTVTGLVQTWTGGAVPYDDVVVSSAVAQFDRQTQTDGAGRYSMPDIALGEVVVTANSVDARYTAGGAAEGTLVGSGQVLPLNVILSRTAIVKGKVLGADGKTPVPNAYVMIENPSISGGLADYRYFQWMSEGYQAFTADSNGEFQVSGVPIGSIRVTASAPDGTSAGAIEATLLESSRLMLSPVLGNGTAFPSGAYVVTDSNGFVYDITCDGSLLQGGRTDVGPLFSGAASLTINQHAPAFCMPREVGTLEQNGRQVDFGPRPGGAANGLLSVSRKAYVPRTGGYIRYLDSVTNPLPVPVTATVEVGSTFADAMAPDTFLLDPAENGNTSAVLQDSASSGPIVGFVFAGSDSSLAPQSSFASGMSSSVSYAWTVTVPPNGTVTLMHFLLQRDPQDAAGAVNAATSLVNLTDPDAVAGMSVQEKEQVANFHVQ